MFAEDNTILWLGRMIITFLLAARDTEVDEADEKQEEEKAAGDSCCNASNGRATQPLT